MGDVQQHSAQGIRYSQLFGCLSDSHEIDSLAYSRPFMVTSVSSAITCFGAGYYAQNCFGGVYRLMHRIVISLANRILFPDGLILGLRKYKKQISSLSENKRYDVFLVCLTPFSLLKLGKWIKYKFPEVKVIADMSDPFSFNMRISRNRLKMVCATQMEKSCLTAFDNIVVLNDCIRQTYQRRYPSMQGVFVVVEQGVDIDFITSSHRETKTQNTSFTFLNAGGFYKRGRNPRFLYAAFEGPKLNVKLVSYGTLKRWFSPRSSTRIEHHRKIPRDRLISVVSQADALVLFDNEYGQQVPGKTIETLAIDKPILFVYANDNSPTLEYVRQARGLATAKNNQDEIESAIKKIVAGNIESHFFDYSKYSWEEMRAKYAKFLKQVN